MTVQDKRQIVIEAVSKALITSDGHIYDIEAIRMRLQDLAQLDRELSLKEVDTLLADSLTLIELLDEKRKQVHELIDQRRKDEEPELPDWYGTWRIMCGSFKFARIYFRHGDIIRAHKYWKFGMKGVRRLLTRQYRVTGT